MFSSVNRKIKKLSESPYASKSDIKKIIDSELEKAGIRTKVYLTRNPLFCYKENSVNILYEKNADQIRVCTNTIKSEEDLKGSLGRELS